MQNYKLPELPATAEDIADMQAALASVAQDPNLTIITGGGCRVCYLSRGYSGSCYCHCDRDFKIYSPREINDWNWQWLRS